MKILEWVAISSSKGSSQLRDQSCISCIAGRFLICWAIREAANYKVKHVFWTYWPAAMCLVAQSRLTFCDSTDYRPLGSSVHGILWARILEWVVMPSFRGSSQPRDRTQVLHTAGGFFTIWAIRETQYLSTAWKPHFSKILQILLCYIYTRVFVIYIGCYHSYILCNINIVKYI